MPPRIIFASYHYWPPDFGGELLFSIQRLQALAGRGFEVTVLTSGRPGFPQQEVDNGVKVLRSPRIGESRPARLMRRGIFALWVLWHLLRLPLDVLHVGDLPGIDLTTSTLVTWLWVGLAKLRGARSVIGYSLADSADSPLRTQGWQGWWRRGQLRAVDCVVSISPALHGAVEVVLPGKSRLIVNGIPDDYLAARPAAERQALRAEAGVGGDEVVFTFLGSIGQRKGFDLLAQAFAEAAPTHKCWRLWVIGPRTAAESQNIVVEDVAAVTAPLIGLGEQVTFWGRVNDRGRVRDLLAASDVFVFPSRREGLGVAPLEAMATGLPIIISCIPGVTDLGNIEGETGLFIEPGDGRGLLTAMLRLGENADLRHTMGAAARARIASAFGWDDYLNKWEAVYTR